MMMLTLMPIIIQYTKYINGFSSETNFYPFIDWQLQRGDYLTESLLKYIIVYTIWLFNSTKYKIQTMAGHSHRAFLKY